MCLTSYCRPTTKDRNFKFALFERCIKHPMQSNFQILRRKAMKIKDNGQYFDFIGGTLSYVTYVMS